MMDRQKVIKGLEELCGFLFREYANIPAEESKIYYERTCAIRDAIAMLKEQDEAYQGAVELLRQKTILFDDAIKRLNKQEWIPVTERLPEVRHAVLCYSPHHKNIWALSLHEDGEWYYWIPMYEKYNPDFDGPITHWMPLPEPPKEGR